MKPNRFHFRSPSPFTTPLRYGVPVFAGLFITFTGLHADAGDILRGGAGAHPNPATGGVAAVGGSGTPATTIVARTNARDTLARTTRTLDAMRTVQAAARAAAIAGPNHLGTTAAPLSVVPNGVGLGGLNPAALGTDPLNPQKNVWTGAELVPANPADTTKVTIKQTTQQALLYWETFNVGKETTLTFDQSNGGSNVGQWIAFNKVSDISANPSQILGNIKADGQIYLINRNGIIFGGSSQVNARGLTVSSLPINDNLIGRGLLNNPDAQFLFSGLSIPKGTNGTDAFTPEPPPSLTNQYGDVTVQAGAQLMSPTNAAKVGGRISLIGANVSNNGSILTPDGQTILASGLEVGFLAHSTSDPSLRGLDVYVGSVGTYAGTTSNSGVIASPRGSITIAGKNVNQLGALDSTTSVTLNGRIDIQARYDAISFSRSGLFLFQKTGTVDLGLESMIRILPEIDSTETTIGSELALRSKVNVTGKAIRFGENSILLAANGQIGINAGSYAYFPDASNPISTFVQAGGQVYLEKNAQIDVAGLRDVSVPVAQNIIELQLRGAELANSPLQRLGILRNATVFVDIRDAGIYQGAQWIGTPLADISGFANLIQKRVGQFMVSGGEVNISAGSSVVMQSDSSIDVSGGSIRYQEGTVKTTTLITGGRLIDIRDAKPDVIYTDILDGTTVFTDSKFGVTKIYQSPLSPSATRFEAASTEGAKGGNLSFSAPSMALDGSLLGQTITGDRQTDSPPAAASLKFSFLAQDLSYRELPFHAPTPPKVIFQIDANQVAAASFQLDSNGDPLPLAEERQDTVYLSPEFLTASGVGSLSVDNDGGDILVPSGVSLTTPVKGSITLKGANITIDGRVTAAGGNLAFYTNNISLDTINSRLTALPVPAQGRGHFILGSTGVISTAGLVVDNRLESPGAGTLPLVLNGGGIKVESYSSTVSNGGLINVSGGAAVSSRGVISYGDAGSLSVSAGQDQNYKAVLGGKLELGATLQGYSGSKAGSLSLVAGAFQIGGVTINPLVTLVSPDFFSEGGFGNYSLTGIGLTTSTSEIFVPGLLIADDTQIRPVVQSTFATLVDGGGLRLSRITREEGIRTPVSLSFGASGAVDIFSSQVVVRGDVVMEEGAEIETDAKGSVSLKGQTTTILGSVTSAGGNISVSGANRYPSNEANPANALITIRLGSNASLSTVGKTVLVESVLGLREGEVLKGGSISVSGNIAAEYGAILDVSGTKGVLDLPRAFSSLEGSVAGQGIQQYVPVSIETNAGGITLSGGQMLHSDATLIGRAGGASATGGLLTVSSGRFIPTGSGVSLATNSGEANLAVRQNGLNLGDTQSVGAVPRGTDGGILPGIGNFAIESYSGGGFDSLSLNGNVRFDEAVSIHVPGSLRVASGGVIYANGNVQLNAAYVSLGQAFRAPSLATDTISRFTGTNALGSPIDPYTFAPTYGTGHLTVIADLIDIGDLSLQGIGSAGFFATNGDIRGNGVLDAEGDLVFKAGQIYTTSAGNFSIFAYDYNSGELQRGSVTIQSGSNRSLPLSAGGTLSIYASTISQGGTLRVPVGTINLGWDGTGTAPADPITGTNLVRPITSQLTLESGSVTSVTAIDPKTGKEMSLPYGISFDGKSWIDPSGLDITVSGAPAKSINLSAGNVDSKVGSTIDIRGGGDLYAYRWISGNGGRNDVLASSNSFAIIPEYGFNYSPYAPFNTNSSATSLNGQSGYTNSSLRVGDAITLGAASGFPAGTYTLLPARYALMTGAFLVTPQSGTPVGSVPRPDGASMVSGYRSNDLDPNRTGQTTIARFEVASSSVVRQRSEYQDLLANQVLRDAAIARDFAVPRLPIDSGYLSFSATAGMSLSGAVSSTAPDKGRGGVVDINCPGNILINNADSGGSPGTLVLSASVLNSFGAESLLIGGIRSFGTEGANVTVNTGSITLDNAGIPLVGSDIILAATEELILTEGASITGGGGNEDLDTLIIGSTASGSGDGALLRISGNETASVVRRGVSSSILPSLSIGANVQLKGGAITLDSTFATHLVPSVGLDAKSLSLSSGQISIQLENPGTLNPTTGLVLSGSALDTLQSSAKKLALRSYSTLDVYGTGQVGSRDFEQLSLQARAILSFNLNSGTASFSAKNLLLENSSNSTPFSIASTPLDGSLVFDAKEIILGINPLLIGNVANVSLVADSRLIVSGNGSFQTSGNLNLVSPLLTAGAAANHSIAAGGELSLNRPTGNLPTGATGGLGAKLTLEGRVVEVNSDILLPSGAITLAATAGDVLIGNQAAAIVSAAGTSKTFVDSIRYTSGGTVNLKSTGGSIRVGSNALITVAAVAGGGDAGQLKIQAADGTFELEGEIDGSASDAARKGRFSLDTGSIAGGSLATIDATLNEGSFTESRQYRIRNDNVLIDGESNAHDYSVSADNGDIRVTGKINSSGTTGGTIHLQSSASVILESGSQLTVKGDRFSAAGKGGIITLEAGSQKNGVLNSSAILDIQSGSTLDLSAAEYLAGSATTPGTSAFNGEFTGKLHLRAPRNAANNDLQISAINGTITGASSVLAEGYRLYDLTDYGGTITADAQGWVKTDGEAFLGAAGTTSANYTTITNRLLANNGGLTSAFVLAPGAEIINTAAVANATLNLGAVGSAIAIPAGGSVLFPNGTPGNNLVRSTVASTLVSASGVTTPLAANSPIAIPVGGSLVYSGSGGTLSYVSGTGGAIAVSLVSGSSYTTGATHSTATVTSRGSSVTLNTAGSSSIALSAGTVITLPTGTVGSNRIKATVSGTITTRSGVVTSLAANTNTNVEAGSRVSLNGAGTLSFASGGTGGAIPIALASGSFTTTGVTSVIPATGDLTLGALASTATADWNLETFRFGEKSAPGVLTLRAAGDLVFYNALSDGFAEGATKTSTSLWLAPLMQQNSLLPINTQSWSYRFTSGADFSAADSETVQDHDKLAAYKGSLLLGKNYGRAATFGSGTNALTATAVADRYQVIRTGSGDITINSAHNIYLLNQFATIYTAGTQVANPTSLFTSGDFSLPALTTASTAQLSGILLGSLQQNYPAQYSMAGGDLSFRAQSDIAHMTRTVATGNGGIHIPDSSRELPTNWLYRRGHVDQDGNFGVGGMNAGGSSIVDPSASTTWWVDFSNFFEGIGTLGGGDVSLIAGRDIQNIDAAAPTNARATRGKASTSKLVELGGGDITVISGRNIDGGVYYIERGHGSLNSGGSITTNSTRSPSLGIISSLTNPDLQHPNSWLPTTLFLGKGGFDVQAAGDLLLGPVANPFLLPAGIGDKFWYKTYFNTYDPDSYVNVTSLGGSVTHRVEAMLQNEVTGAKPLLQAWLQTQQLFRSDSASNTQPWLRLNETEVSPFATVLGLMPPNLRSTSFSDDVNLVGDLTLFPATRGQIEIVAAGSIDGLQAAGLYTPPGASTLVQGYASSSVNLSDTDPASLPRTLTPYSYQSVVGLFFNLLNATNSGRGLGFLNYIDHKFAETGSTAGASGVLQTKQALHSQGVLHLGDTESVKFYAQGGDIEAITLYSPKATRVIAGNDITDVAFYFQNTTASDLSVVSAGRDLVPYNANTATRVFGNSSGNLTQSGEGPQTGDIQISGPGSLQVIAGRNIDLGIGASNADGTGVGIISIGNARNPALPEDGADLIIGAGLGAATSLAGSSLKWAAFIEDFVTTPEGLEYVKRVAPGVDFAEQSPEEQARIALEIFYLVLRDAGRDFNDPDSPGYRQYTNGYAAIESLFGEGSWEGEILTEGRDIRTRSGGDISILAPGGGLTLANTTIGNPLTPPGIVTESGGKISIFTDQSVNIGIGRIFTLRGGDATIWSTNGDIAAGSSSRTISAAPPTRVIIDPQSGSVQTDLAGLATGGGIGVLASVEGVDAGDVDLIAPSGVIDAGDAGIRVSGNINLAAVTVVNAANISAGGTSTGAPVAASAPSISAVTSASNSSTAAGSTVAKPGEEQKTAGTQDTNKEAPSLYTVEVIGYGGGAEEEEKDKEEKTTEGAEVL